jgi:hypothetical protein
MAKNLDKTRTGPKPFVPTTRQRHEVELAVAVGMSLEKRLPMHWTSRGGRWAAHLRVSLPLDGLKGCWRALYAWTSWPKPATWPPPNICTV